MDKKKYPVRAEDYELYEEIGQGASASVYRAMCIPNKEIVAIKVLDFECATSDLDNISHEAHTMTLVDHPNVLNSHCSFVYDHNLWVVMPFMPGGSCLHILKSAHPEGFEEVVIATILREALKALVYLHGHGIMHRDVKAGNILICDRGSIKLGDLGVSACLYDSGDRQHLRSTFVGTPCWMAPEVMEHKHGYDLKADIWSFGITALELAHGHAPFSKYPPIKVLLMTLQNAPPGLDYESDRKFSKSFKQMIASCLVKNPSQRPSAAKLLKHSFFKQAKSDEFIVRKLLKGMPALGDRLQALKKKEEDMLTQKKIPDGQKEEMSQNEYKRGISCWNFDLEDVKAQTSLNHDEELADKDQLRSSSSSDETVFRESEHPNQVSCKNEVLKAARSSVEIVVDEIELPKQFSCMKKVSKVVSESGPPNQLPYMKEVSKRAGASYEVVVERELPKQLSYMKKVSKMAGSLLHMNKVSKLAGSSVDTVFGDRERQHQLHMNKVSKLAGSSVDTVFGDRERQHQLCMNNVSKVSGSSVDTVFGDRERQHQLYMNNVSKVSGSSVDTVFGDRERQHQLYMNNVSKVSGSSVDTVFGDRERQHQLNMNKVSNVAGSSVDTVFGDIERQHQLYMNKVSKDAASTVETLFGDIELQRQLAYMNVSKAAGPTVDTVIGSKLPDQLSYMNKVSKAAYSVETV